MPYFDRRLRKEMAWIVKEDNKKKATESDRSIKMFSMDL